MRVLKISRIVVRCITGLYLLLCAAGLVLLRFCGLSYYVIQSGSMQPAISINDVVVSRNISETEAYNAIKVGDVATYFDGKSYVTHRVYEKAQDTETGEEDFIFKGDNNNTIDRNSVKSDQIRGKQVFLISNGAWIFEFLNSVYGIVTLISILLMLFMLDHTLTYVMNMKAEKLQSKNDDGEKLRVDLQPEG